MPAMSNLFFRTDRNYSAAQEIPSECPGDGDAGGNPQLTVRAVSSITKDVWFWASSVPVNFSVMVCPA